MNTHTTEWTLTNHHGLEIFGNTEHPATTPKACLLLLHGFKGYKDYGFIPLLAKALAKSGILVHRFNFSCSGMTNDIESFANPELFAIDSWNRQVEDVECVVSAIANNRLDGNELPLFIVGHSRGGATTLLCASRKPQPKLSGIVTINAIESCCNLTADTQSALLENRFLTTPSARTGQSLRVNASWLQEQLDDPPSHDLLTLCKDINCAALILHGTDDESVELAQGERIANVIGTALHPIQGANHVLNTANPAPQDAPFSPQLDKVHKLIQSFVITNSVKTPI